MKVAIASLMLSMVFGLSVHAADTVTDNATGTVFPSTVSFNAGGKDYQLQATGVSTRKKFFVKLYGVAHYLQGADKAAGNKFQAIMDPTKAKQLTLKWVRDVPGDKVQEGYHDSFNKSLSQADAAQLKPQIDQYIGFFSAGVKKGDEQILRWTPGGRIDVIIDGKPAGSITNEAFAKALWGIWFGDHSVVDRDNLVSLLK